MGDGDATTFAGTESFYAQYRPGYGTRPIEYLVDRFEVTDADRVLDLGCGTGQLAIPLAECAGEVVGVDPNPEMLDHARDQAARAGRTNLTFLEGTDADLADLATDIGTIRLATMGRSFHWMDQVRTLQQLHALLEPAGGVAIITDREWLVRGPADWQTAVYDVAADYPDDLPTHEPGAVDYEDPWDELLADQGFQAVETRTFDIDREWRVDDIVGYVFSLSYCSPETFGDEQSNFEDDVRERLAELGSGPFHQTATVEVISGREPE